MRDIFVFYEFPEIRANRWYKQKAINEYIFEHIERINSHLVENNKTFEWKNMMINKMTEEYGSPVKLNFWQRILASEYWPF